MAVMTNSSAQCHLGGLTSATFARIATSNPVVLLPLGSQEDHGPYLPMGDYRLAGILAGQIAEAATALGVPTYMAPVMPFGVADFFGSSPGGLAISAASFRGLLEDLLQALLRHGLTRIILLNGHAGNVAVIHDVTLGIKRRLNLAIPSVSLWKIAGELLARHDPSGGDTRFGHGGEPLFSLNLALRPAAVQVAETALAPAKSQLLGLPVTGFGTVDFAGLPINAPVEFDQVPRDAAEAAHKLATPELGQAVAGELVALAAQFVVHFAGNAQSA